MLLGVGLLGGRERGGGEVRGRTACGEYVFETDVEGSVCGRGKCHSHLACNVLGLAVFIAHCIADLKGPRW